MGIPFRWKTRVYRKTDSYEAGKHFGIIPAGAYHYKVYFYEGSIVNTENGESRNTKPLFVDSLGNESETGKYQNKTRLDITNGIDTAFQEVYALGTGVQLICDGYEVFNDSNAPTGHRVLLYSNYEYGGGASFSSPAMSESASTKIAVGFNLAVATTAPNSTTVYHELSHLMGLAHNDGYGNSVSFRRGDILYGNPNFGYMSLATGFLKKNKYGSNESYVTGYDILYNTSASGYVKIYGTLNNDKYTAGHPSSGKKFYEEGGCLAFLWDSYKKELAYSTVVDINGYFEFRIRVLPPTIAAFNLFIASKEFNDKFIHKNFSLPDDEGNNADTVVGVKKDGSDNGKYYYCVENHISSNDKRPVLGNNSYTYWEKTSRSTNAQRWRKDRRYYIGGQTVLKPENGYIYYTNIGKFENIVPGGSYDVSSLISAGTVSGSLSLNKKATRLNQIYIDIGAYMEYQTETSGNPITSKKIEKKIAQSVEIGNYDYDPIICGTNVNFS